MKILILQDDFPPISKGGAGQVAYHFAKEFVKQGHRVGVVTITNEKRNSSSIEYEGIKIFTIFSSYPARWRAYKSLYNKPIIKEIEKIILEFNPQIVNAHNIHYHISYHALKLAKKFGAGVFLTAHDVMLFYYGKMTEIVNEDVNPYQLFNYRIGAIRLLKKAKTRYNPVRNIVIKRYLNYVDRIIAVSNELKIALNQNDIHNVTVINNGIEIVDWTHNSVREEEITQKYRLFNKRVVMFVGAKSGLKGIKPLLKVINGLTDKYPNLVLLVIGLKPKRINSFSDHIIFTGWIEPSELKYYYFISEIVVMPSICFDTFGMVNIEAMAAKKPVITNCYGGSKEIVVEEKTGYVVNPLNTADFTSKLDFLLANIHLGIQMGEAGYKRVRERFLINRKAKEYVALFEQFIDAIDSSDSCDWDNENESN
jgi:glycosyltransferase involved in cell wall biosynthesis